MQNQIFLDKLKRAYMMEEEMAGMFIDLCQAGDLPADLAESKRKRLEQVLLRIKADTLRHKKILSGIIGERS